MNCETTDYFIPPKKSPIVLDAYYYQHPTAMQISVERLLADLVLLDIEVELDDSGLIEIPAETRTT